MIRRNGIEAVVTEILQTCTSVCGRRNRSVQTVTAAMSALAQRDYDKAIGVHFSRRELHRVLAEFSRKLPTLNRSMPPGTSPKHLHRTAGNLGVRLQLRQFTGPDAEGLRGFYAGRGELLKRPLICLNGELHPVAVAASFWHEVGHHLSAGLSARPAEPAVWSFEANYSDHLEDALEVLADMMVCFAFSPKPIASKLFAKTLRKDGDPEAEVIFSTVWPHMRAKAGFDFVRQRPPAENLTYVASMLHFGKIRLALLRTYGV